MFPKLSLRRVLLFFFSLLLIVAFTTPTTQAAPSSQAIATWCVTGEFQDPVWQNNATALFDDGTNGDLLAGDGIYSLDFTITTPSSNGAGQDYYEWKVVTCNNWETTYPSGNNAFFRANIDDVVKFIFDTNSYSDGFAPTVNIHNVTGDIVPTSFTAVGDWQGWDNANPNTEMTETNPGIYELDYVISETNTYMGKVVITGDPRWDGFDANGRHVGTPDNINFTTTQPDQTVRFTLDLNTGRLAIIPLEWCVTGEFQDPSQWDNAATPLNDAGFNGDQVAGDGIFTREVDILSGSGNEVGDDYYEWKVVACGDWNTTYPPGNNAFFRADAETSVIFTLDTNTYSDGFVPAANIHNVTGDVVPDSFTAVGDWQGWNNADPNTELVETSPGIYELSYVVAEVGAHMGKAVITGDPRWDGFDANGRHKGTPDNINFNTTIPNQTVDFVLDLNTGRMSIRPQSPPGVWCVAGAFQDPQWDNAATELYDDGTNGDVTSGDGIFSRQFTITDPSGNADNGDRFYEWKVVTCGNWETTYPPGNNAYFFADIDDTVLFTFDTNSYSDGFVPATNIHNVTGDDVSGGFTAVGEWQGWDNANPATAMTETSPGVYELDYVVADQGAHMGKVVITGHPLWHGFDANGRHVGTPDNINFVTAEPNETVHFELNLNTGRLLVEPQGPPPPEWCVAGDWQGWNNAANPLYDNGTNGDLVAGDSIFSAEYSVADAGNHEWKAVTCGVWDTAYPSSNSWFITTTANQTVRFSLDLNTYADGFSPVVNIVHANDNFGTSFTAVGDFNGNDSSDPNGLLQDVGDGIYEVEYTIPSPGSYVGHINLTGDTRGWGTDGRSINPGDLAFETSTANEVVFFTLDTNTSRLKVVSSTAPPPVWDSVYHSGCSSRISANCAEDGDHAAVEEVPGMPGTTFSSVQPNGSPVGSGVSDVFAYDDDPIDLYMLGDADQLTDDNSYPFIRYWTGSEQLAVMSQVDTWTGTWHGRPSTYDVFLGSIPAQPTGDYYYWLNAQHEETTTTRALCMSGNPENAVGQPINVGGDCSFNDYAFAVVDDDTSGPEISNVTYTDNGTNDEVCADVVETGTDSGDDDSDIGEVILLYSDVLGDIIIGGGTAVPMTLQGGDSYCATGFDFADPTYYRVEARNDDDDHAEDVDVSRSTAVCEGDNCDIPVGDDNILWDAVWHDTRDLYYRNPFGAVVVDSEITIRLRTAKDDLTFAFVQMFNTPSGDVAHTMTKVSTDSNYDYYEATIPADDTSEAGQLYYKFILMDGSAEDWYVDDWSHGFYDHEDRYENGTGMMVDDGLDSSVANNSFNITVYTDNFASTIPAWAQNAVIYQIMPDRFRNGDPSNDEGWPASYDVYGNVPFTHDLWNEAPVNPRDEDSPYYNFWSADFFGGDLQGIMDELDYLQSIGVTAIYLNPIFASPSNHGYDTTDYLEINPRYGDNEMFALFAAEAQERGIAIILDGVFNHSGSDSVYFDRYGRWDLDGNPNGPDNLDGTGACEGAGSPFADFYEFMPTGSGPCYDGNDYESWFGYDSLPVLIDWEPGSIVRDFVFDVDDDGDNGIDSMPAVVQYWYSLGADGWRFDVANEIPYDFWQEFRDQVKGNDGLIGPLYSEVWFEAQPWVLGDQLDATMNYRYRKAVLGFLIDSTWTDNDNNGDQTMYYLPPSDFDYVLNSIREDYPAPAWYTMMNLMGSHDTNRALFVLREQSTDLDAAIAKLQMMAALQFTYPGAPTIYYGDEAGLGAVDYGGYGLWGAGYDANSLQDDPYNRHPYPWDPEQEDAYDTWNGSGEYNFDSVDGPVPPPSTYTDQLRETYSILGVTHNSYSVLRTGDVVTVLVDDSANAYAYARVDGSTCALAIFNRSTTAQSVTINDLPTECSGTFYDVLNEGAAWTAVDASITVNNIPGLESAVLVPGLGGGLILPPGDVNTFTVDNEVGDFGNAIIDAMFYDVAGQPLPAGVSVNFELLSGNGSLSSTTAVTNGTGVASVTYNADVGKDVAVIQASIIGPNGVLYSDSTTIYVGFESGLETELTVETGIGPHFADGFTAGMDVAATKIGTGEPVISLAQFEDNPYPGDDPVFSAFVDVHLDDPTDVDMLAIRVRYTDEFNEADHQLYYWDGFGWQPTSEVIVDTDANEVIFEVTADSSPSLSEMNGTGMVIGDPGFVGDPGPGPDGGGEGFVPLLSKTAELQPGDLGLPGEQITWVISLTNNGNAAGTNIVITDTLEPELRLDGANTDSGTVTVDEQTVTFAIPSLDPGTTVQMRILTTVLDSPSSGLFVNTAYLTADGGVTASATANLNAATGLPDTGYPPAEEEASQQWWWLAGILLVIMIGASLLYRYRRV